jgi:hypothetical protein
MPAPGLSVYEWCAFNMHTPDGGDELVGFGDEGLLMATSRVSSRAAHVIGARCGWGLPTG